MAVVVQLERVIEVEEDPGLGRMKLVFDLRRVYKGPPSLERRDRLVLEGARGDSCTVPERSRMGLYLHGRAGRWRATACDVTSPRALRRAATGAGSRAEPGCR